MNNYMTNRLPTVECCACSERHGEQCPTESCMRKCRGNYCVVDFDGIEQVGCSSILCHILACLKHFGLIMSSHDLLAIWWLSTWATIAISCPIATVSVVFVIQNMPVRPRLLCATVSLGSPRSFGRRHSNVTPLNRSDFSSAKMFWVHASFQGFASVEG